MYYNCVLWRIFEEQSWSNYFDRLKVRKNIFKKNCSAKIVQEANMAPLVDILLNKASKLISDWSAWCFSHYFGHWWRLQLFAIVFSKNRWRLQLFANGDRISWTVNDFWSLIGSFVSCQYTCSINIIKLKISNVALTAFCHCTAVMHLQYVFLFHYAW